MIERTAAPPAENSCYTRVVPETWTVRRIIAWIQTDLARRGIEAARLEADLLVAHGLSVERIALYIDLDRPLVASELDAIRKLVERRRKREPMAYILGDRDFYGRSFRVTPAVLVPRPDTETLVERALQRLPGQGGGTLLDVCTGTGAVAITIAAERPDLSVVASDIDPAALEVARDNAARLGVGERVELRLGDLFAACKPGERFAAITANPPYIASHEFDGLEPEVRDFEPRLALDAGPDGLAFYRRIATGAPQHLLAGGALLVEVGIGQAREVCALFEAVGLRELVVTRDLGGVERVVEAVYAGAT